MIVTVDRVELEDVGGNPAKLARAILDQIGQGRGAVPLEAIAKAVDITEVRTEELVSIEGALVTTRERDVGQILVNASSKRRRWRYTVAHELGHFLNPWHTPSDPTGFRCSRQDLSQRLKVGLDRHQRQEAEANTFAIELLAPRDRIRAQLAGAADLEKALEIADDMEISREAAVRRYIELHQAKLAVVFSQNGQVIYTRSGHEFPPLSLSRDSQVPGFSVRPVQEIVWEEADPADWLRFPDGYDLSLQTLHQRDGRAITLLHADAQDEDLNEADVPRFPRR